jgi:hypothetical protein
MVKIKAVNHRFIAAYGHTTLNTRSSRPIIELGWVTAWKYRVSLAFFSLSHANKNY